MQAALPMAGEIAAALPTGWATFKLAQRYAGPAPWTLWAMIAVQLAVALTAVFLLPLRQQPLVLVGWALGALACIDLMAFRLPDILTLPLTLAGVTLAPLLLGAPWLDHLIGAAAGFGVLAGVRLAYRRLRGREGLGLGDAKLAAAGGAWLSWQALPMLILLAAAGGLVMAAVELLRRGRGALTRPIAFGAPLSAGIWILLLLRVTSGA